MAKLWFGSDVLKKNLVKIRYALKNSVRRNFC